MNQNANAKHDTFENILLPIILYSSPQVFSVRSISYIGVARGCSGCTFSPRAVKNFGVIYRENL